MRLRHAQALGLRRRALVYRTSRAADALILQFLDAPDAPEELAVLVGD